MVSYCQLLGVRSFVLEARSWSGKDVPVNLHQMNAILCSNKNGQGPKAQLPPSEVQVMAEKRKISAGGTLRTRSSVPAQQSLLREPGAQPNWPLGSSDHLYRVGQVSQAVTQADCHCY